MKRSSKTVQLILITSALASCNKPAPKNEDPVKQQVFMRADSTAPYTNVTQQYQHNRHSGAGNALLWYMAFRHLGGGMGYASNGLSPASVTGTNRAKATAYGKTSARGGFGSSASKSNFSSAS